MDFIMELYQGFIRVWQWTTAGSFTRLAPGHTRVQVNQGFFDLLILFSIENKMLILNDMRCTTDAVISTFKWLPKVMFLQDRVSQERFQPRPSELLRVLIGWTDRRGSCSSPHLSPPTASFFADLFPDTSLGGSSLDSRPRNRAGQLFTTLGLTFLRGRDLGCRVRATSIC